MGASLVLLSIWLNSRILHQTEADQLPENCHVAATMSRVALESALGGNPRVDLQVQVIAPLDQALASCRANMTEQPTSQANLSLSDSSTSQLRIFNLHQQLGLLKTRTLEAWETRSQPGIQRLTANYNQAFNALAAACRDTRTSLNALATTRRFNLVWINAATLVVLFGFFSWGTMVLIRELKLSNQKTNDLAKLSLVANKTDNVVLITHPDSSIEWINSGFTRLAGWKLADAKGKKPGELLFCTLPSPLTVKRLEDGFAQHKTFNVDALCTNRSGQRYWLSLNIAPVHNAHGDLVNFVAVGVDSTARKRTEEELARVNHQKDLLLNAAGEGICGLDLRGTITFANPAAARITGWSASDGLTGKPVSSIVRQLQIQSLPGGQEEQFSSVVFKDPTVRIGDTDLFRRKDGSEFPVDYISTPIREGNQLVGFVIVFHDITDRRQAEAMRARQARQFALRADIAFAVTEGDTLQTFLQACSEILLKHVDGCLARIWTHRAQTNVLELRASAGLYTHLDGQHARVPVGTMKIGMVAKERLPQISNDLRNDRQIVNREWVRAEGLTAFVGFPLLLEHNLVGVIAVYSRNKLPDNTLELFAGVADSIAQAILRKRVEEKVTEQAALLDKSQDAIVVMDMQNRCIYWNKSAERLYGWPAAEAHGQTIDELIYSDAGDFDSARNETLERGEFTVECSHCTRAGQSLIVESQWTLVHDDEGRPKSFLLVNTNISERKKIEAQFLRTQRMESIGTLAGGIAHDLNNVLAPIMMSVEILRGKLNDPQSNRMLSIVESSAKRGADMVKQVLTFARGVDGERSLLQPKHLLGEIVKMVRETFPKTIQLKTSIDPSLPPIMGDATQLHQVMVNLTVNARDAMPEGGTLSISASRVIIETDPGTAGAKVEPGTYLVLKITDTGTGIPREVLDKIFEPFFTTKEVGRGTGLGLSTVLGIIKSHGGVIQVQTEENKGTTFTLHLPAATDTTEPETKDKNYVLPVGHGELILAVDDEAGVLSMTKETLEVYGYRVLTATDGTEAVAAFTAHRHEIRVVLTDILMPHMDGPSTIRVLKRLDPNIKIIAASGLMDVEKVREGTGIHNIAFLPKPYTAERLLETLRETLDSPATRVTPVEV